MSFRKLNELVIFEFFSGIGGFHHSLKKTPFITINKIFPFDVNTIANSVYSHNFSINPCILTLESFSKDYYETICKKEILENNPIMWTMSPPCQPFTRQGLMKDIDDNRTDGFVQLIKVLSETRIKPNFIVIENVKNFESSETCKMVLEVLMKNGYNINQFLIDSSQLGIPNNRLRYYLLATNCKKLEIDDHKEVLKSIVGFNPKKELEKAPSLKEFIGYDPTFEKELLDLYLKPDFLSKESSLSLDMVTPNDNFSSCFTKAYGKLFKGAGSFLLIEEQLIPGYKQVFKRVYKNLMDFNGKIRYFSPEEILKLLCFEDDFVFPRNFSNRSKYKLLGNSLNITVVKHLLNYLLK